MMQSIVGLALLVAAILIVWFGRPEINGRFSSAIQRWKAGGAVALFVTALVAFGATLVVDGTLKIFSSG